MKPLVDLTDIYLLLTDFNKHTVYRFLDKYTKGFIETTGSYWYLLEGSESEYEIETDDIDIIMNFILAKKGRKYIFYFHNPVDDVIKTSMLFFNPDRTLVIGLCVEKTFSLYYKKTLYDEFNSKLILETYDNPPPDNLQGFIDCMIGLNE